MLQAFLVYLLLMASLMLVWRAAAGPATLLAPVAQGLSGSAVLAMAVSWLLFTLVVGLRDGVGGDYPHYVGYFEAVSERTRFEEVPYEWGFFWLISTLRAFDLPPASLFLATCAIQMAFLALWLRRHLDIAPWYIFFFFTSLLVFESMNTIRQAVAYAILLPALQALHERRTLHYVALVFLASLFHSSALIFLPLYVVLGSAWLPQRRWLWAALLLAYVSASAVKDTLFDWLPLLALGLGYEGYSEVQEALFFETEVGGFSMGMLFLLLTDLFLIGSAASLAGRYRAAGFHIYYKLYVVGALLTPVVLYANYIPFARLAFYFTAFKPVVLAFAAHYWLTSEESRQRPLMRVVTVGFLAAYLLWFLMAIKNKAAWCAPFQFVFQT